MLSEARNNKMAELDKKIIRFCSLGPKTVGEIAQHCRQSKPSMQRNVQRLENRGELYVNRNQRTWMVSSANEAYSIYKVLTTKWNRLQDD